MVRNRFVKVNIERRTRPQIIGDYAFPVLIAGDGEVPFTKLSSYEESESLFDAGSNALKALEAMFDQPERSEEIGVVSFDSTTGSLSELLALENPTGEGYLVTTSLTDDISIKAIAEWADGQNVIFMPTTNSIALAEEMAAASELVGGKLYENTNLSVHDNVDEYMGARAAALASGHFFGKFWLKFKSLRGLSVPNFTTSEINRIHASNANTYLVESGRAMVSDAKLVGGEYMDIIQTEHYIVSEMTNKVFGLLTDNNKVPYTDAGIDVIHGGVIGVLEEASRESRGVLALDDKGNPTYSTSAPRRKDIPTSFVSNRILPDVKFTAIPSGAIGEVIINGVLTFEM